MRNGTFRLLCKSIEYCMPWMLVSYQGRCYSLGLSHWKTPARRLQIHGFCQTGGRFDQPISWENPTFDEVHIKDLVVVLVAHVGRCFRNLPDAFFPEHKTEWMVEKMSQTFLFWKYFLLFRWHPALNAHVLSGLRAFWRWVWGSQASWHMSHGVFYSRFLGSFQHMHWDMPAMVETARVLPALCLLILRPRWLFGFEFLFFHLSNGCPQVWWYSRHDLGLLPLSWTTAWRLPPGGGVESVLWLSETVNVRSDGKERYSPQMNWLRSWEFCLYFLLCLCLLQNSNNFWAAYGWTNSSTYTSSYIFPSASCQERLCGQDVCNATALALAVYARALLLWSLGGRRHLSQDCWILGSKGNSK